MVGACPPEISSDDVDSLIIDSEKLLYSSTEKKKHVCHSAVVTRR